MVDPLNKGHFQSVVVAVGALSIELDGREERELSVQGPFRLFGGGAAWSRSRFIDVIQERQIGAMRTDVGDVQREIIGEGALDGQGPVRNVGRFVVGVLRLNGAWRRTLCETGRNHNAVATRQLVRIGAEHWSDRARSARATGRGVVANPGE